MYSCKRSTRAVKNVNASNAHTKCVGTICFNFMFIYGVSIRYKSINERAGFIKSSAHTKVYYPTITSTSCSTCTCRSVIPSTVIFYCPWYEVYPFVFPRNRSFIFSIEKNISIIYCARRVSPYFDFSDPRSSRALTCAWVS